MSLDRDGIGSSWNRMRIHPGAPGIGGKLRESEMDDRPLFFAHGLRIVNGGITYLIQDQHSDLELHPPTRQVGSTACEGKLALEVNAENCILSGQPCVHHLELYCGCLLSHGSCMDRG